MERKMQFVSIMVLSNRRREGGISAPIKRQAFDRAIEHASSLSFPPALRLVCAVAHLFFFVRGRAMWKNGSEPMQSAPLKVKKDKSKHKDNSKQLGVSSRAIQ